MTPGEQDEIKRFEFLASLAPILTAIKRSGSGDGLRVQFDVAEINMADAILLMACPGKRLKLTVEILDDDQAEKLEQIDYGL
ncbi:MAG: hypothetical protein ABIH03_16670 [Pseudomonadota bacterium]